MIVKIVIGPTASGKSALAVDRAQADNGTIINADAMQCYAALPVLTAQPTEEERKDVPHVMYGHLDPRVQMTAADWVDMATGEIGKAHAEGSTPYLVGGTGLYIKALMEGLSPMPDVPEDVRANVRARLGAEGLPAIYADLQNRDPAMASRLKAGDTQRILRAMEVLEATGKSLADWQAIPPQKPNKDWCFHVIAINPPKEKLEAKIRARLDGMMKAGLMEEVEALSLQIDEGTVPADALVTMAHGFRHFRNVLKGALTLEEALEATAIETRQYTKRQRTWLRHQIAADETLA